MTISKLRFSWLEYYSKNNFFLKIYKFLWGTLFMHSRAVANYLFKNVFFEKEDLILDIGSGDGNFSNWIAYFSGCKVKGIDKLLQRVELSKKTAKRYNLNNDFLCFDIEKEKIDFKKNFFDKILIIDTLEHFRNPKRIIKMTAKWLKKGGVLFISTPTTPQHRIFLHSHENKFNYGIDKHHSEGFRKEMLINWLRKAGFRDEIKSQYVFYKIYQLGWESSEVIKKCKILYKIIIPFFDFFIFLDKILPIGKNGNGIIIIAKK